MSKEGIRSNRSRLTEIATVLASYGFGHIYRTKIGKEKKSQDAESLRLAFEELGPSFIKIGQILSTRPDLLPADYIEELSKLRDQAPPFSFKRIKESFEEDFNEKIEDAFEWIDETPLASASIAQVHRARTIDGEEVIIKVQRPDMEENLLRDIRLFSRLLELTPEVIKDFVVDADIALAEVEASTKTELDFRNEVMAIQRFRENNKDRPVIAAPKPIIKYTSKRVLVEEYVEGINGLQMDQLLAAGYDKKDFVEKFVYTFLTQVFEDGFFHGDPHPGNIIIRDQQIVYIDFGLFGELSEANRKNLLELLEAIVLEDVDRLMNLLLQMAIVKQEVDRYLLYQDIENFFYQYVSKDLANIHIGDFFNDVLSVSRKHSLVMPTDFIMLGKSLAVIEGVVSDFDVEVNLMQIAKSYVKEHEDFSLGAKLKSEDLKLKILRLASDSIDLPGSLKDSLETLSQGRARLNLEVLDWEKKSIELNKMVNRIVFAIIIAALILASALITISTTSPGLTSLSVIVFLGAGIMGLWLLISIIRSGTL